MNAGFAHDVFVDDGVNGRLVSDGDMKRAHVAAALNKRHDSALVGRARTAFLRDRRPILVARTRGFNWAIIGFVGLNDFAFAAHRL